jgi:hypothetical protein
MSQATIIISAQKAIPLLATAIECAQTQTMQDLEIICLVDSPETTSLVNEFVTKDKRISISQVPEGTSFAKHRHNVVLQAKSDAVFYINERTLITPDHVAYLLELLKKSDVAHPLPLGVKPGSVFATGSVDLAMPMYQELLMNGNSRVPFSSLAHHMKAYRALKIDWSDNAPENVFLLRHFLNAKNKIVSGKLPTALVFPEKFRAEWTQEQSLAEAQEWKNKIQKPGFAQELYRNVLETVAEERATLEQSFDAMSRATEKMHNDYQVVHDNLKWLVKEHKRLEDAHQRMSQENSFLQADLAEIKNKE